MDLIIPVFQFEIRFNHILDFSQIVRNTLAPYVKLTDSIKIDKQNTVEETYFLNFEEDGYMIIVSWDRAVFKGQGSLDAYFQKNSPIGTLFFDIFQQICKLKGFGEIKSSVFYGIAISKYSKDKDILGTFSKNILAFNLKELDNNVTDFAVVVESNTDSGSSSITFGPYLGPKDLSKRPIKPIDITALGNIDFEGVMLEYKRFKSESEVNFNTFIEYCSEFNGTFKKIWKKL
ncbi:hypothetical protein [Galbibacter sp.]|uniref:hypothetical protein n=1 Tax=Galbibacter sp. TaxID=2918471 RepID=UPI003A956ADC